VESGVLRVSDDHWGYNRNAFIKPFVNTHDHPTVFQVPYKKPLN